ncbi:MAG: hypothetical protein ACPLN2_09740 [Thermoproteota archaeon]
MSSSKEEEFIELDLKRILEKYLREREATKELSLQTEKPKEKTAVSKLPTKAPEEYKQVSTQKEQILSTEKQLKEGQIEDLKNKAPIKSIKEEAKTQTLEEKKETSTLELKEKTSLTFSELEASIRALGSSNRIIETFSADSLVPMKAEVNQEAELEKPEFFVFGYPNSVTVVVPVVTPEVEDELVFVMHLTEKMPLTKVRSVISELNRKLDKITRIA